MRLALALGTFFKVLFDRDFAERLGKLDSLATPPSAETAPEPAPTVPAKEPPKPAPKPARSEAITLLATLQREARFVDLVMEPLTDYTDAQVGAAARDVLRDCGETLERLFAIRPVVDAEEGSAHETPADFDAARYRLTGKVAGDPPYRGQLVHHGWQATRCELPTWSGKDDAALIVASIELELT